MLKTRSLKKRQYWVQVCLIFGQITFAGAWAGVFLQFQSNAGDNIQHNGYSGFNRSRLEA